MGAAVKHKDAAELEWAERWVLARLSIAHRKDHIKTWKQRLATVRAALHGLS